MLPPAPEGPTAPSADLASALESAGGSQSTAPNMIGDFFNGRGNQLVIPRITQGIFNGSPVTATFNGFPIAPVSGQNIDFFSPGPGTRLPRDPVVYFFSPRFRGTPDITGRGGGVRSVQVRRVSSSGAHDVYRVAVRHSPGGGDRVGRVILAVRQNGGTAVTASYTIDPAWRPPASWPPVWPTTSTTS